MTSFQPRLLLLLRIVPCSKTTAKPKQETWYLDDDSRVLWRPEKPLFPASTVMALGSATWWSKRCVPACSGAFWKAETLPFTFFFWLNVNTNMMIRRPQNERNLGSWNKEWRKAAGRVKHLFSTSIETGNKLLLCPCHSMFLFICFTCLLRVPKWVYVTLNLNLKHLLFIYFNLLCANRVSTYFYT